jgi:methionyl-tRNA formyltransferase
VRVVFLGSQEIGEACLRVILRGGDEVVGVGTFEPAAHEAWTDGVAGLAREHGLHRIRGRRFRTAAAIRELQDLKPDILFAIGWRWILPPEVLAIPAKGCLGIHGSLLPRLRGFAPVNWALIRGEAETGPTLFYFDEGTDTGDVVGARPFPITDTDDAATVRARLAEESVALLAEHLDGLRDGTAPRTGQDHSRATIAPRRRPEDGRVDWSASPQTVVNWVRGLTRPYPGAFTTLAGETLRIWKVAEAFESLEPGAFRVAADGAAYAGVSGGAVRIVDATLGDEDTRAEKERAFGALSRGGRFES